MNMTKHLAILAAALSGVAVGQQVPSAKVQRCETLSLSRPGKGVAYKGEVVNSDYRFSGKIPAGLVGWGAGFDAPFHGFTVYLKSGSRFDSCIVFTISTRVDLPDGIKDTNDSRQFPANAKIAKIGNQAALQTSSVGLSDGVSFGNWTVSLVLARADHQDDVSITLVTPSKEFHKTKPVFDAFISSLTFW
jgi:hypothetical protein